MTGIFLPKIQWFFIELTNNCNAACSHCPSKLIRRKREYMPIGTAKRIIEEIAAYKRNNPEYQGYVKLERAVFLHVFGEPMLHPDLFDIIQHGGSKGIEFCLVTNGTLLDESNIERVLNSKLSFITISINADDKVVFESNHPGCDFDDYMATVKEFIKEVKLRKLEALKVELQFLVEKGALGHARHGLSITKETVKGIILQWRKFVSDLDRKRTALKINFDPYWNDLEKFLAPGNDQIEYRQAIDKNICILLKSTCNYGNAIIERGKKS